MIRRILLAAVALAALTLSQAQAQRVTQSPISMSDALSNLWGLSVVSDGNGGWMIRTAAGAASAAPTTSTYTRPTVTTIPVSGSGAVTVFPAGSIKNGCELQNTGTVPIYISLVGTAAATDQTVAAGASYRCPVGTPNGLSALNSSASVTDTVAGQAY